MKLSYVAVGMMLSSSLVAQDVSINGTISQTLKDPSPKIQGVKKSQYLADKEIKLLKIQLSEKAKKVLLTRASNAQSHTGQFAIKNNKSSQFPSSIELGMNDVPVLDQGNHGSCVTFAATGAIDAVLGKGDYVSQLCHLQLGNYLAENGYLMSGWSGSFGRFVFNQIDNFGLVSKDNELAVGCGGLTAYPLEDEADPVTMITPEEYRQISEPVGFEKFYWTPILDSFQAFSDRIDTNKTLDAVKTALTEGDRVVFATLLADPHLGVAGALGKRRANNDTWVLTPELARSLYMSPNLAGHEMIITGYNDYAVAKDENGYKHTGLLTLRNSWGQERGDKGNFYMSYEYFKVLVTEAQRIRPIILIELDDLDEHKIG